MEVIKITIVSDLRSEGVKIWDWIKLHKVGIVLTLGFLALLGVGIKAGYNKKVTGKYFPKLEKLWR